MKRPRLEEKLDEAIDETFPASDPPATTVVTGARIRAANPAPFANAVPIRDNRRRHRFEIEIDRPLISTTVPNVVIQRTACLIKQINVARLAAFVEDFS